jgi:hypothetical protein
MILHMLTGLHYHPRHYHPLQRTYEPHILVTGDAAAHLKPSEKRVDAL